MNNKSIFKNSYATILTTRYLYDMDLTQIHPSYYAFLLINIWLIYKVIKAVVDEGHNNNDDDEDDGGIYTDDPDLDLPPGVTLPKTPELIED